MQILYGNLAPEGSVAKITGKEGLRFEGTAKVYDSEELMMAGLNRKEITKGTASSTCYKMVIVEVNGDEQMSCQALHISMYSFLIHFSYFFNQGMVVVIRYEGPKGGPGMPEMLTPTSAIMGAGLGNDVAMVTDGRFSGGSHGFIIGHVTPEAQVLIRP